MHGPAIAAVTAIIALSGCVQPQPLPSVETPAREPPRAAAEQPVSAATTAGPVAAPVGEPPPAQLEQPAPAATPARPVTAPAGEAPPAVPQPAAPAATRRPVVTAAESRPPAAPPAPPRDSAPTARTSQPPTARSAASEPASARAESMPPATPPVAAPAQAALASPALDLTGLEQRLRETRAIGVFTKLSLKNQVDDLLNQFRSFYQGQLNVPMAELRERYELLLFKVLTLLQDADRDLAEAIAASREAIWGILSDPQKLARI